ncbi:MAG: sulfur carrier protein ThiS [Planctomycetales bacterium]
MNNTINILFNGEPRTVEEGISVATLLEQLQLAGRAAVAVELNRAVIPRDQHALQTLAAGDELEVVTLVGGG